MSELDTTAIKRIFEAAIFAASGPLTVDQLAKLLPTELSTQEIRAVIAELTADYVGRGIELQEVATGFRFQVCQDLAPYVQLLWEERPPKYSRAFLETLALIVYRQPITRAEIEEIRGVAVSSHIMKTLLEREWIKVLGHKELPGRPAVYGSTKKFLEDFNLKSLSELPPLSEIVLIEQIVENAEQHLNPLPAAQASEDEFCEDLEESELV